MTRCRHGELFAVCRECPNHDHEWVRCFTCDNGDLQCAVCAIHRVVEWSMPPDRLYVPDDDEEPFTLGPRLNASSGFAAGCAVLLLVAAVAGLAGYLLGVTR